MEGSQSDAEAQRRHRELADRLRESSAARATSSASSARSSGRYGEERKGELERI